MTDTLTGRRGYIRDSHAQKKGHVPTSQEGGTLKAKDRGLRRN